MFSIFETPKRIYIAKDLLKIINEFFKSKLYFYAS